MLMTKKGHFFATIKRKQERLVAENKEAFNKGDMQTYQNNANVLKGMHIVLNMVDKYLVE